MEKKEEEDEEKGKKQAEEKEEEENKKVGALSFTYRHAGVRQNDCLACWSSTE